ncbi:hypothetical protein CPB86DRAFT_788643 [Serendipita vermifera]|nr:hypothetical protein CPB86DRAFT_788643 [Serendipita vermifera]
MPRPKQADSKYTASQQEAIILSDQSGSDDDLGTEQGLPTRPAKKPPTMAAVSSKHNQAKVPPARETSAPPSKASKGKAKAKPRTDEDMDIDTERPTAKYGSVSAANGTRITDPKYLIQENERLQRMNDELIALNDQLQLLCDKIQEENQPTERETMLQAQVDQMSAVAAQSARLLDLRNSEYTKSRLINRDPYQPADFVTLDWAEREKENAIKEVDEQLGEMENRVAAAEQAVKDAEKRAAADRKELAEVKRQLAIVQRELDTEVEHSKKLQAEANKRPPPSSTSSAPQQHRGLVHEAQRKIDLFENMTGLLIVSYSESIRQPGNVKMLTYTCVLTLDERDFPFKLVVWDEKQESNGELVEHVVYSPSEPIDQDLNLGYLAKGFTFPRSQLNVFYQNMIAILSPPGEEEEEEAEEEDDDDDGI